MEQVRQPWMEYWREVAEVYLPRRYLALQSEADRRSQSKEEYKSQYILDSTGTIAARTLASGMMNGITSPSRQWLRLGVAGSDGEESHYSRLWLDHNQRVISTIFNRSNFYTSMATLYFDLVVFGTGVILMYEDEESFIHCYNPPLGEYYLDQGADYRVNTFARKISLTVRQMVERWGYANCSAMVQDAWDRGGAGLQKEYTIHHLIEPNDKREGLVLDQFAYQELYWEAGAPKGELLQTTGFHELPGMFVRWETVGNDPYGVGPSMEALGDVIQLQVETKRKGQIIDKMADPPTQADVTLKNKPMSFNPGAVTFVNSLATNGKSIQTVYEPRAPIDAITQDILQLQARIREIHHNDLFRMIAQLETVRSATEVEALREERLVLLGPVLERFENEALEPSVRRVFGIANRAGLTPPPPPDLADQPLEVQFVSILSVAQRAAGTAPVERMLQLVGEVSGVIPEASTVLNMPELLYNYARDIGVPIQGINPLEEIKQQVEAMRAQAQAQQQIEAGGNAAQGAATLSQADVGGGLNALQLLAGANT